MKQPQPSRVWLDLVGVADEPEFAPELPKVTGWLLDAAELLTQPDPGPTPWLVEDLIVASAIVACVGKWKTTKSYGLLDLCISVGTGEPGFGDLAIPDPGLVTYVCEESGQAALWRRLDSLCRGRALDPERLRGTLNVAPNKGIKLDDPEWQERLLEHVSSNPPRLIVFDPLARMKAPTRNESAQNEMAGALEFLRTLRDAGGGKTTVAFVHHIGHQGEHMRGSSDLETIWETRLTWKREGKSSLVTVESDHREAEAGLPIKYRIAWDATTRTMRFNLEDTEKADKLEEKVRAFLEAHPDASANDVDKAYPGRRTKVLALVRIIKQEGGSHVPGTTGNHPAAPTPVGGSPDTRFRGSGTTTGRVVPEPREPLEIGLTQEQLDAFLTAVHEQGLGDG